MDPLSLLAIASLAAAAAAHEVQKPRSSSEAKLRAWQEFLQYHGSISAAQAVEYDALQEQGEWPPGYMRLYDGRWIPRSAFFDLNRVNAAYNSELREFYPGHKNAIDWWGLHGETTEEDVRERFEREFLRPHLGRPVWIQQVSGHLPNGYFRTFVLDRPLKVLFPESVDDDDYVFDWYSSDGFNEFTILSEVGVQPLEPVPDELLPLMLPGRDFDPEESFLYATGIYVVGYVAGTVDDA